MTAPASETKEERRKRLKYEAYLRRKNADPEGYKTRAKAVRKRRALKAAAYNKAYYATHKPLYRKAQNEYRRREPEKVRAITRRALLKKLYGITDAQYEAMLKAQNGLCGCCRQKETWLYRGKIRRLSVDHDHRTGSVRELLCRRCNWLLGLVNDDAQVLWAAIRYLGKHHEAGQNHARGTR